jgi:hypothetical protein
MIYYSILGFASPFRKKQNPTAEKCTTIFLYSMGELFGCISAHDSKSWLFFRNLLPRIIVTFVEAF